MTSQTLSFSGLPQRLIRQELLTAEEIQQAQKQAREERMSLVYQLVTSGKLSANVVAGAVAEEFGDPILDLSTFQRDSLVKDLVDPKLITKHHVLPLFRRGSRLFVAVADPTNLPALEEIRFNTGLNVETIIVEQDKLTHWIDNLESDSEDSAFDDLDDGLDDLDIGAAEEKLPTRRNPAQMMPPLFASSTSSCWMPSKAELRIFISSHMRKLIEYDSAKTGFSKQSPNRRSILPVSFQLALKSCRGSTSRNGGSPRMDASNLKSPRPEQSIFE